MTDPTSPPRPVRPDDRPQALHDEIDKLTAWLRRTKQGRLVFDFGDGGVTVEILSKYSLTK